MLWQGGGITSWFSTFMLVIIITTTNLQLLGALGVGNKRYVLLFIAHLLFKPHPTEKFKIDWF